MFFNLILEQKENKARGTASTRPRASGDPGAIRTRFGRSLIPAFAGMSGEDALAFSQSVLALLFVFKPVDCRA